VIGPPHTDYFEILDPWASPKIEPALLAPLVGVGDLCLIAGSPGSGKTSLACSLLCGLLHRSLAPFSLGGALVPNLDQFDGSGVAIVDAENSKARWHSILNRYLASAGWNPSRSLKMPLYVKPEALGVGVVEPTATFIRDKISRFADRSVRLIVVDSMIPVFRPVDAFKPEWVTSKLLPLLDACRSFGITVIILCHCSRDRAREPKELVLPFGTMMQEAVADCVIGLQRPRSRERYGIRLQAIKSRRAYWIRRGASVNVYFSGDGHYESVDAESLWPLLPPDGDYVQPLSITQQKVLAALQRLGEASAETLSGELGMERKALGEHLTALHKKEFVAKFGGGPNTRWKPTGPNGGKS